MVRYILGYEYMNGGPLVRLLESPGDEIGIGQSWEDGSTNGKPKSGGGQLKQEDN